MIDWIATFIIFFAGILIAAVTGGGASYHGDYFG